MQPKLVAVALIVALIINPFNVRATVTDGSGDDTSLVQAALVPTPKAVEARSVDENDYDANEHIGTSRDGLGKPMSDQEVRSAQAADAALHKTIVSRMVNASETRGPQAIYFLGDSVMRNQFALFCAMIGSRPRKHITHRGHFVKECQGAGKYANLYALNIMQCTLDPGTELQVQRLQEWGLPSPSVIFLGTALHILHLHPAIAWTPSSYQRWRNYEHDVSKAVAHYNKAAPSAKLVLLSATALCPQTWFGEWKAINDASEVDVAKAAIPCADMLQTYGVNRTEAMDACEGSFLKQRNLIALNDRLRRVEAASLDNGLDITTVDDFNLTDGHCNQTKDGVHFNTMILQELARFIDALSW